MTSSSSETLNSLLQPRAHLLMQYNRCQSESSMQYVYSTIIWYKKKQFTYILIKAQKNAKKIAGEQ